MAARRNLLPGHCAQETAVSVAKGYSIPEHLRAKLNKLLKRELPVGIWNLSMQGNRLLVAQDKAEDMHKGLIHKPRTTVETEQNQAASGWVILVGPYAGDGHAPHPKGIVSDQPSDLLGLHIYYQMWAGKVFRTDDLDGEWGGKHSLIILTDRDVQSFDENLDEAEAGDL